MTSLADRIRCYPDLPAREVDRIFDLPKGYAAGVRWKDKHPHIVRESSRRHYERTKSLTESRTIFNDTIDKMIVLRRARKETYGAIASALGLANRNVVAGRIKRLREAGRVVP